MARPLPGGLHPLAFVGSPDEGCLGGRVGEGGGQRQIVVFRWLPGHLVGLERIGQALQVESPDEAELVVAPGARQETHHLADEHLAAGGRVAESFGFHDRSAEAVALLPCHVAGREPHAQTQRFRGTTVEPVDGPLHAERAGDGIGGGPEGGHEPVAHPLDLDALVGHHGVGEQCIVLPAKLVGQVVAQPAPQLGGAHQVGE